MIRSPGTDLRRSSDDSKTPRSQVVSGFRPSLMAAFLLNEPLSRGTGQHTFILRAFVEPRRTSSAPPTWRGTIRHLPDDVTRSVKNLEEVSSFIRRYLQETPLP